MRRFKNYITLMIILLLGCEEPFNIRIPEASIDQLVVEGQITNEPGPYQVRFTKAVSLGSDGVPFITVQTAAIESRSGARYPLTEVRKGVYETSAFRGQIGESYKLTFSYADVDFESDWVTINPPSPIDEVQWELEERETEIEGETIDGVQLYVNSTGSAETPEYYRWELTETWQIVTQHYAPFFYLGNNLLQQKDTVPNICWQSDELPGIFIETTTNLEENVIFRKPLSFLLPGNRRFSNKLSIEVAQYSIDEEEFIFWKTIKESIEEAGGLFNTQPGQINGNIKSVTGPSRTILGYFRGSSVTRARIFISRDEVPQEFGFESLDCEMLVIPVSQFPNQAAVDAAVFDAISQGFIFIEIRTTIGIPPPITGYALSIPYCSDCVATGGTARKPDYWED